MKKKAVPVKTAKFAQRWHKKYHEVMGQPAKKAKVEKAAYPKVRTSWDTLGMQNMTGTQAVAPAPVALPNWWRMLCEREIERVMPKVEEYGATDLAVMGRALVAFLPPEMQTEAVGMEMACAFYALGKIGRLVSSFSSGKLPREDSWHDMGVYARMAQRIRETGRWP